ncbi:peptidase S11 [Myxococcota bacterium]|nr:peptidase S11 [Myxococcota bacterium]
MRVSAFAPILVLPLLSSVALASGVRERERDGRPHLRSESVVIRWADTKELVIAKNADVVRPIASVTKLLSGLVLRRLDASRALPADVLGPELPGLDPWVTISEDDKDRLKYSRSRLAIGRAFKPEDLFAAALGASDNRAMYASVRARRVERSAFVEQMNALAKELGMTRSSFRDPAGIDPGNVSTARDLLALLDAASSDDVVRAATLHGVIELVDEKSRALSLANPNRLVRSDRWDVVVGKTGYTVEAGRSLALRTTIGGRPVDMVFLGAREMASIFGDAARVRRWMEERLPKTAPATLEASGETPTSTAATTSAALLVRDRAP